MRSQAASRSAPSSDSGRTRISLPSVSTQTLSGFRAMLRNHAGCAADPPAVPVTIKLVAELAVRETAEQNLAALSGASPDRRHQQQGPAIDAHGRALPPIL